MKINCINSLIYYKAFGFNLKEENIDKKKYFDIDNIPL